MQGKKGGDSPPLLPLGVQEGPRRTARPRAPGEAVPAGAGAPAGPAASAGWARPQILHRGLRAGGGGEGVDFRKKKKALLTQTGVQVMGGGVKSPFCWARSRRGCPSPHRSAALPQSRPAPPDPGPAPTLPAPHPPHAL